MRYVLSAIAIMVFVVAMWLFFEWGCVEFRSVIEEPPGPEA